MRSPQYGCMSLSVYLCCLITCHRSRFAAVCNSWLVLFFFIFFYAFLRYTVPWKMCYCMFYKKKHSQMMLYSSQGTVFTPPPVCLKCFCFSPVGLLHGRGMETTLISLLHLGISVSLFVSACLSVCLCSFEFLGFCRQSIVTVSFIYYCERC